MQLTFTDALYSCFKRSQRRSQKRSLHTRTPARAPTRPCNTAPFCAYSYSQPPVPFHSIPSHSAPSRTRSLRSGKAVHVLSPTHRRLSTASISPQLHAQRTEACLITCMPHERIPRSALVQRSGSVGSNNKTNNNNNNNLRERLRHSTSDLNANPVRIENDCALAAETFANTRRNAGARVRFILRAKRLARRVRAAHNSPKPFQLQQQSLKKFAPPKQLPPQDPALTKVRFEKEVTFLRVESTTGNLLVSKGLLKEREVSSARASPRNERRCGNGPVCIDKVDNVTLCGRRDVEDCEEEEEEDNILNESLYMLALDAPSSEGTERDCCEEDKELMEKEAKSDDDAEAADQRDVLCAEKESSDTVAVG